MIRLLTDTANQVIRLTLDESRVLFTTEFTDYLIIITREENSPTGIDLAQVAVIVEDNTRFTELTITTVGLEIAGQYRYEVYGQNSDSNLDPTNAVVVGKLEIGWFDLYDNSSYISQRNLTIPDDVINGG